MERMREWRRVQFEDVSGNSCRWEGSYPHDPFQYAGLVVQFRASYDLVSHETERHWQVLSTSPFPLSDYTLWQPFVATPQWDCRQPGAPTWQQDWGPSLRYPGGSSTGLPIEFRWGSATGPTGP